jgi:rhodanese-related sulfurtransferase
MPSNFSKNLSRDILFLWGVGTVSLCIGLTLNELCDKPIPLSYETKMDRLQMTVSKIESTELVHQSSDVVSSNLGLDGFRQFVEQHRGIVLDARPEIFHRLGHVPTAFSLPRNDFEAGYAKIKAQLERNKDQPLAVYCSDSSCEDSTMVEQALVSLGYTHVSVFRGGWNEWTDEGLPIEKKQ